MRKSIYKKGDKIFNIRVELGGGGDTWDRDEIRYIILATATDRLSGDLANAWCLRRLIFSVWNHCNHNQTPCFSDRLAHFK